MAGPDRLGKVTVGIVMQGKLPQEGVSVQTGWKDLERALQCSSCRTLGQEKA